MSSSAEHPNRRLTSLDVFRGITIAGMILVNDPGSWKSIYWPLEHAEWNGWTPTDMIFPFFLFIVGVSIPLSLGRRKLEGQSDLHLLTAIVRRSLIVFTLGLFLQAFPHFDLHTIRIPGVLQRIAVCYLFASLIFVKTGWKSQMAIGFALLFVYAVLMKSIAVPGFAAGDLSRAGNLAAYIDRTVLGVHTWRPDYDPEGILGTIPAIVSTMCGVLTGSWLRSQGNDLEKTAGMFVAGIAGVVIGWALDPWFPINKALWSPSYVLFMAGMALQLFALLFWIVDIKGYKRWSIPFLVFGVNAITVYVLSSLAFTVMALVNVKTSGGASTDLQSYIYTTLFASWAAPLNASLLFAIFWVLLWLALMWPLYHRKIYIRI